MNFDHTSTHRNQYIHKNASTKRSMKQKYLGPTGTLIWTWCYVWSKPIWIFHSKKEKNDIGDRLIKESDVWGHTKVRIKTIFNKTDRVRLILDHSDFGVRLMLEQTYTGPYQRATEWYRGQTDVGPNRCEVRPIWALERPVARVLEFDQLTFKLRSVIKP